MPWTITAYKSYLLEQSRLWLCDPSLRKSIKSIDLELKRNEPRLELYIEQHADRVSPHQWIVQIGEFDVMVEMFPDDRLIQLVWLKLRQPDES